MVSSAAQEGPVFTRITEKLQAQLAPSFLQVVDDSHKHAGHAAMKGLAGGETHFAVTVVSGRFASLSVIERHRLVNEVLAAELDPEQGGSVHALQIKAKTPEQWAKVLQK